VVAVVAVVPVVPGALVDELDDPSPEEHAAMTSDATSDAAAHRRRDGVGWTCRLPRALISRILSSRATVLALSVGRPGGRSGSENLASLTSTDRCSGGE
jgi:hypothetical protein